MFWFFINKLDNDFNFIPFYIDYKKTVWGFASIIYYELLRRTCDIGLKIIPVPFNDLSNVLFFPQCDFTQKWHKFIKFSIIQVVIPAYYLEPVVRVCIQEVLPNVVNNYDFREVSANQWEILYCEMAFAFTMLSVKAMGDLHFAINRVQDPVCIVLESCSENYYFKVDWQLW
jgi:hypothetical protein